MIKKLGLVLIIIAIIFGFYVNSRPAAFKYEKSGLIQASPEAIYPYIVDLQKDPEWNPFDKNDPTTKKTYSGNKVGAGSILEFEGSYKTVGSGRVEILRTIPNKSVELELEMKKPFYGLNLITYTLMPEGSATRFTWTMTGNKGFMSKLMGLFIDCDTMVESQMEVGVKSLTAVVEAQNHLEHDPNTEIPVDQE